jgi:hypothetical protein
MNTQLNGRYFVDEQETPEPEAANRWFSYAEEHDIDIGRAISLWEDAATPEGEKSRGTISASGIRIVPPKAR